MARICADCIYFDDSPASQSNPICRHNSPTPLINTTSTGKYLAAIWPEVDPNDWCREGYSQLDGSYDVIGGH